MTLSIKQAYQVMYLFLERYYKKSNSDDLGSLLGVLGLLDDETTVDPAFWNDWEECVERIINATVEKKDRQLTSRQLFQAMYLFLKKTFPFVDDENVKKLFEALDFEKGEPVDPELKCDWFDCVERISKGQVPEEYFFFRIIDPVKR